MIKDPAVLLIRGSQKLLKGPCRLGNLKILKYGLVHETKPLTTNGQKRAVAAFATLLKEGGVLCQRMRNYSQNLYVTVADPKAVACVGIRSSYLINQEGADKNWGSVH